MKKGMIFFVLIFSLSLAIAAEIIDWEDKYVNDFANVLNQSQIEELRSAFLAVEEDTTAEMVFVSDEECTSKGGPSQYAIDLGKAWGVGKEDKNNGLLILYCKAENKIFAATGYGLEGILPDSKIGRLLDENYVPYRDEGEVSEGILWASIAIAQVIEDNAEEVIAGKSGGDSTFTLILIAFFIISFITVCFYLVFLKHFDLKIKNKKTGKITRFKGLIGVKDNSIRVAISIFFIFVFLVLCFVSSYFWIAVVGLLVFTIYKFYGARCEKDGLRIKYARTEGKYNVYKCPKGHIGKIIIEQGKRRSWGGGFGGGSGGGGFGGGGFGGGGAGR